MEKQLPAIIKPFEFERTLDIKLRVDNSKVYDYIDVCRFALIYYMLRIDPDYKLPLTKETEDKMDNELIRLSKKVFSE